ncbi:acetate--CoA ligase family protein [Ramlibacter sp. WS9]|uniref:acetate--CoA ligase family protein n=1 Tax=Ramlibacter sp. WS9 TaxID=1882741 RepID=UPI001141C6BA|nr:acetate--CoA ligase family protein [Ramlibacter sp. WS9]ROZ79634.1 ATP-grasp domain-containing protein [Ramlibacter sp. WS9]
MSQVPPQSTEFAHVVKPVGNAMTFQGYAWGVRQPSLQYAVHADKANEHGLLELDSILSGLVGPDATALAAERSSDPVVTRLLMWPTALLRAGSHSVFQPARASVVQRPGGTLHLIQQPCMQHGAATSAVNFVIGAINLFGIDAKSADARQGLNTNFSQLLKSLKHTGMRGFNPAWFLAAADELRVPWAHLRGDIFLFGWGAKGRWLQSSFTDQTSKIGTNLARNKVDGAAVLRTNGVPVPEHVAVHNEREAVAAAEKMGYPVVVKPIDLDGGKGVWVNIRTAAAVREAYANAVALSKQVLVERHVNGRDFRIQVVHGEVHGVLERVPGGVTGNGVDSVKGLLERQNLDRKHAADDRRFLHGIADDKEALGLLVEQDLDWESVPGAGRFVRLRSASNVASGGVPTPVPLDHVHPDNLSLAVRATRLLRLDVAGVDLLIPDIGRSWLEGGASICEVNAQPQMFTTMHKPMLASLLGGTDGRIPVAVVVGAQAATDGAGPALHRDLLAKGVNAGLVCGNQVHVGRELVCNDAAGAFAGARMLCNDQSVEAMVICVSDKGILNRGWPVDHCDVLVLDTRPPEARDPASSRMDGAAWLGFSAHLSPHRVIVDVSDPALLAKAKAVFGAGATVESAALGKGLLLDASVADALVPIR